MGGDTTWIHDAAEAETSFDPCQTKNDLNPIAINTDEEPTEQGVSPITDLLHSV